MAKSVAPKVRLRPLPFDSASIKVAAEIISLSFASDPLIRWLSRDRTGPGWETLTPTLQRWQEARLRGYAVRAIAMEAVTVSETPEGVGSCFLFPPGSHYRWSDVFWWPACFKAAWDQYWAKPTEPFSDPEKIGTMMEAHNKFEDKIKDKYPSNSLYYLEIAAVKPDCQGMGVGKAIMQWVVEKLGGSPCFLECTDQKNIGFYEKYGFKVAEEKTLAQENDATSTVTLYYMIRDPVRKK